MMDASKYRVGYFPVGKEYNKWVTKDHIEKSPVWCSVDMRDGNQSLVIPMSLEEKLEYYKVLLDVGFKEIEVGFPAASETEYEFLRSLSGLEPISPSTINFRVFRRRSSCKVHTFLRFASPKSIENLFVEGCTQFISANIWIGKEKMRSNIRYCERF